MASRLSRATKIWTLARDLGLKPKGDPVLAVREYCEQRVMGMIQEFSSCETLTDLIETVRGRLEATFEIVRDDEELRQIRDRYIEKREAAFANLEAELSRDVFGITFQRRKREPWEPRFVSVIDCRGDKAARKYFTKWHELAHLLCLTDQLRLAFRRTHSHHDSKDPEESMMDVIAGHLGFLPSLVRPHVTGEISFDTLDTMKEHLCPEASREAALTGFVQAWPTPVIFVKARLGFRKEQSGQLDQMNFGFRDHPVPALRATTTISNQEARRVGFRIHQNMRVPQSSILRAVFEGRLSTAESDEDLGWWEASDGTALPAVPIRVKARRAWEAVEGLITPKPS